GWAHGRRSDGGARHGRGARLPQGRFRVARGQRIAAPGVGGAQRGADMTPRFPRRKRIFDLALVVASAPLTVPVLLACALAVRFDSPGPVVFSQTRTGQDGHPFRMLKFRTMVENAEQLK